MLASALVRSGSERLGEENGGPAELPPDLFVLILSGRLEKSGAWSLLTSIAHRQFQE